MQRWQCQKAWERDAGYAGKCNMQAIKRYREGLHMLWLLHAHHMPLPSYTARYSHSILTAFAYVPMLFGTVIPISFSTLMECFYSCFTSCSLTNACSSPEFAYRTLENYFWHCILLNFSRLDYESQFLISISYIFPTSFLIIYSYIYIIRKGDFWVSWCTSVSYFRDIWHWIIYNNVAKYIIRKGDFGVSWLYIAIHIIRKGIEKDTRSLHKDTNITQYISTVHRGVVLLIVCIRKPQILLSVCDIVYYESQFLIFISYFFPDYI